MKETNICMLAGIPQNRGWIEQQSARPLVLGVDEAGRGPLAGPVVASAVVLGVQAPKGLADSKKLSAKKRASLEASIRETCGWALGVVEPKQIDTVNIFVATMQAMTIATRRLTRLLTENEITAPIRVLIDGNHTPDGRVGDWSWAAEPIIGGDALEPCISAASILAKEWRDREMVRAAGLFPHYGWERNKGYGTKEHMEALRRYGPSPLHRRSFAPVAQAELPL